MHKLIDKAVIFCLCLFTLSLSEASWMSVVAMLCALAVASLNTYFENGIPVRLCAAYSIFCLLFPAFIAFLPLIAYDCAGQKRIYARFCWVVALPVMLVNFDARMFAAVALFCGIAFLLQHRTVSQMGMRSDYYVLMDNTKERAMNLEILNRELMEKQDYEVRLATLAERNRIAREIHDNVGHLLTRSILQIGAMRVIYADDVRLSGDIAMVGDALSDAMSSIRNSVHDLRGEAVDLRLQLRAMIDGFAFCKVKLEFDAGDLPGETQYCFYAIVREALNNIAKHSGATEASVTVREHPALCQLVIEDNGNGGDNDTGGIGLKNMAERVDALGGVFRVERGKGFRIFVSVPKGG